MITTTRQPNPWHLTKAERLDAEAKIDHYRRVYDVRTSNCLYEYANQLTKKYTAFASVEELLASQAHNYRPTFLVLDPAVKLLADLYDLIAEARGLPLRSYRINI